MSRPRILTDTETQWAHGQWIRGCALVDVAQVLGVSRWTLQREFKRRGWQKPTHFPDEEWIMPHIGAK